MSLAFAPLKTASLLLRHFTPGDAVALQALNGEATTRRWLPSHAYRDVSRARSALEYLIGSCSFPGNPRMGPYVLAVEHLTSGELIGHVGFSPLDAEVEISFAIGERHRRRGYASEAIATASHWVYSAFDLRSVLAVTARENTAAGRTLDRCGFRHLEDKVMRFQGIESTVSVYRLSVATGLRASP